MEVWHFVVVFAAVFILCALMMLWMMGSDDGCD